MKAINFIKYLFPCSDGPKVEIRNREELLYSKEINYENVNYELKALKKLCKKSGWVLTGFAVERNTLRIHVV